MNHKSNKNYRKLKNKSRIEIQAIRILKNNGIAISSLIIATIIIITSIISISGKTQATNEEVGISELENSENVNWIESSDGIRVPVPKGYSASKIQDETSVDGGFVIYEGENIDWSFLETNNISDENGEVSVRSINMSNNNINSDDVVDASKEKRDIISSESDSIINEQSKNENQDENIIKEELTKEESTNNQGLNENVNSTKDEEVQKIDSEIELLSSSEEITQLQKDTFKLQTEVNQYVWVPIEDISKIYGVDSNGKLWGKLYTYSSSSRSNYNWTEKDKIITVTNSNREPALITSNNSNYDIDLKLRTSLNEMTQYELLSKEMEQNFYNTIESIKKYGGFYIGRYETGGLNKTTGVVRKMQDNSSVSGVSWYTMYEKCKTLGENNDSVNTSMIWGSLWDATLEWFVKSSASTYSGTKITYRMLANSLYVYCPSLAWGNYPNNTFEYYKDLNQTIATKSSSGSFIPTGSAEYTKVNNIYDMAGNVNEWTMEASSTTKRTFRGGDFGGYGWSASDRYDSAPTSAVGGTRL